MSILPDLAPLVTPLIEKGGRTVAVILALGLVTSIHLLVMAHFVFRPLLDLLRDRKDGSR